MSCAPFIDRSDAGRQLAAVLREKRLGAPVVVAIPRGGVPVGVEIARALRCRLKLIILRKLFLPSNPEAGFGAMAPDGTVFIDEDYVDDLGLSRGEVDEVIRRVRHEVERRHKVFASVAPDELHGRDVLLVDDGIAGGYSMASAARFVRAASPASVRVAVPCAPARSLARIRPIVEETICLRISSTYPFAVADFYHRWHDLTDDEVFESLGSLKLG